MEHTDIFSTMDTASQWSPIAFGLLVVGGVLLVLFGRKISKPVVGLSGLVFGGLMGLAISDLLGLGQLLFVVVLAASVVSCVVAMLLFRIWMSLSCTLVLALAAPALVLAWTGTPPPEDPRLDLSQPPPTQSKELWQAVRAFVDDQKLATESWWNDLPGGLKRTVVVATGVAAVGGLLVGLLMPMTGSALISSLLGAWMILWGLPGLTRSLLPSASGYLPSTPRQSVIALGLITLSGIVIQWTLWRRRTDSD
ncbi:MAG: hypothetical protein GC164_07635 [Phycisphaera sp.]|nr:hypothetical protein [Phycisphaera sp.]